MDKSYKKPLLLITFGVILFAAFNNLNYVANFLKSCIGLLSPILSGLLLAFVLSVPMRGLAKRLRRKLTKATDRQIDMISLLLTLICVIAVSYTHLCRDVWVMGLQGAPKRRMENRCYINRRVYQSLHRFYETAFYHGCSRCIASLFLWLVDCL